MQSSLELIDRTVDGALARRSEAANAVSTARRAEIKRKSVKPIAGFEIFDEAEERRLLDAQIERQRSAIDTFVKDRAAVREKLTSVGCPPLAVVPRQAWEAILKNAGMFAFQPDAQGRVRISRRAFDGLSVSYQYLRDTNNDQAVTLAAKDWTAWLRRLFPDQVDFGNDGAQATLVLPPPPADVVTRLLAATKAQLTLRTAAVPEAIGFKESIPQLRKADAQFKADEAARIAEEARRLAAWRADPIVFADFETASAVVAQFGDFPIEQEIVEAVVAADDFIPEKPKATHVTLYDQYMTIPSGLDQPSQMRMMQTLQQQTLLQQPQFFGTLFNA